MVEQSGVEVPGSPPGSGDPRSEEEEVPLSAGSRALHALLLRSTSLLANTPDVEAALQTIAQQMAQACKAEGSAVYLFSEDGRLESFAGNGLPARFAAQLKKLGHTQWVVSYLASTRIARVMRVPANPPYDSPLTKSAAAEGLQALLIVPILRHDTLLAVILLCSRAPIDLPQGDPVVISGIADVAALALSSMHLQETRRWEPTAQDQFLDLLSHELRTPLTSIVGFTQVIRRKLQVSSHVDARLREQLEMVWAQAMRLSRLLDTFADITSIERGDFALARDLMDLGVVLRASIEQSKGQVRSRHPLRLNLPDHPMWIYGDMKRLEHVFGHVMTNAFRYSPENRPIAVTCEELSLKREVEIDVIDRGPGIPGELHSEIFKRFYPTEDRRTGGLGVGLYVSRAIVEAHGGRLQLMSRPGEGTTVRVTLPMA